MVLPEDLRSINSLWEEACAEAWEFMGMRKTLLTAAFVSLSIFPLSAAGQNMPIPPLHSNDQVSQIILQAMSYASVARACQDNRNYYDLKAALVQSLELAKSKGGLTSHGLKVYRNTEFYLEEGAVEYKRRPYVTCGQAYDVYPVILDYTRRFVRSNG
jgi:hypothetical protein